MDHWLTTSYNIILFLILQTDDLSSLHSIGTAAVVVQVTGTNWPKPAYTLLVTGLCRFRLEQLLQETPYPIATVTQLDKLTEDQGKYPSFFHCKMEFFFVFFFQNGPKNLDPSYKMDLDYFGIALDGKAQSHGRFCKTDIDIWSHSTN